MKPRSSRQAGPRARSRLAPSEYGPWRANSPAESYRGRLTGPGVAPAAGKAEVKGRSRRSPPEQQPQLRRILLSYKTYKLSLCLPVQLLCASVRQNRRARAVPCVDGKEIGTNAQDEMDMVAHDGIAAELDREDRSELLEPLADPFLAVLVIMSGFDVEPTKERPANASRDAMIDPNLVGRHDLSARVSRHRDVTPLAATRSGGR